MPSRHRDMLTTWNDQSQRDRRNTRWALVVAVAVHALLFRLQLPENAAAEPPAPGRVHFLVQTPRFAPPPPRPQRQIPPRQARRVPVPDRTPDGPELPPPERIRVAVDLRDTDLVFGLPDAPPPETPSEPLRVGGDVLPPVKLYAPPPAYPEMARRARIQGRVHLEAVIDTAGRVGSIRVVEGLPLGLDRAAVEAVSTWRFEPATYQGEPVAVIYNLTIFFRLS